MSFDTRALIDKIKDRIRSGIIFMGGAYANRWLSERYTRKYASEYAELATGIGLEIALDALGIKERLGSVEPYLSDLADAMSDYGFYQSLLEAKVVKAPMCWFKDTNTIKCINFDVDDISSTYVTVYVDDTSQTISSTSGSPSDFEISLSSPVTEGWRKVVVIAGNTKKDSFRGKIYARS